MGVVLIGSFSPLITWLARNIYIYGQLHGLANLPMPVGVKTSIYSGTPWSTNIMAGGLCFGSLYVPRTLSKVAKWYRRRKILVDLGLYAVGYHWAASFFNVVQVRATVLLDPINTRLTAGIYCVFILLAIIGARQISHWVPKVHPTISMGMLLLSIVIAQTLSNPNRESKKRQQEFTAKYSTYSFINLFGFTV